MDELVIYKHDFQVAKNKIQKYAESAPKDVALPKVKETAGLFGLRDHRVTGPELNQCMGEVQASLISLNNATKAIISEFKDVYNAFEALDKDYISGIVISVNAAKKASDEAKKASDDISKTIGALKATVAKISDFQKEVRGDILSLKAKAGFKDETLEHLEDIDVIWMDVQTQQDLLTGFENQLNGFKDTLSVVNAFKENLDKLNHLIDIDSLWNGLHKHYQDYEVFYNKFIDYSTKSDNKFKVHNDEIVGLSSAQKQASESFQSYSQKADESFAAISLKVNDLSLYSDKLKSFSHLEDIDQTWEALQTHYAAYDSFCLSFQAFEESTNEHISDNTNLISELQSGLEAFHSEFKDYSDRVNEDFNDIRKAISTINQYTDKLKSFAHLNDIDKIWQDLVTLKQDYSAFKEEFKLFDEKTAKAINDICSDVSTLKSYKSQLEGLKYLPKIDDLWVFTHALSDRTDVISSTVDKHNDDLVTVHSDINDLNSRFEAKSAELSHRIRVNHIIAATTFVFVLILLILNILGIL